MRLLDDTGENYGVVPLADALAKAKEAGTDLVEVSPGATPPVCRIIDYGKYLYQLEKKSKDAKKAVTSEMKNVRIGIGTSQNDLERQAALASKFLQDGHKVRIELALRGRAKYLAKDFHKERIERILHLIPEKHRIAEGLKQGPRGSYIVIERTK
ncbi:MAG: translation initiation factor IF-3 [Candidatus Niyogibacteria bacterium]|nr:translation initiation factor IF-3 [Candidatus Niyogibacteria bacterium]